MDRRTDGPTDRRTDGSTDRRTGDFTPSLHDATVTSAATAAAVPPLAYTPEVPFLTSDLCNLWRACDRCTVATTHHRYALLDLT